MEKNKTGKYLKYAIGEIILVVIGILIALQINTWNQQNRNHQTLKQFLVEYKEELRLNIKDFKIDLKLIESQKEIKDKLLKNKRLDTIKLDSLEKYLETRYIMVGYSPTLLKRFENSQITDYGKYDSLFLNLQEYYGYRWPEFNLRKTKHNNQVDKEDEYWRYEQNNYEFKFSNGDNALLKDSTGRKQELIRLLKSPVARNIFKNDFRRKILLKKEIERLIGSAEDYHNQINNILE
jgi:hypothetical protein